jgi:uncharacterized protein (DUF1800 family)
VAAEPRPAAHFLDQATFGPTAADVAAIESAGAAAWLQQQFALPESPMPTGLDTTGVRNQLFLNMANGPDQLRQRMIFALSQIIVVSANKTGTGDDLIPWVRLLSRNAFGNYRTLLREVTLSPTMGKFLDLVFSRRATSTSSPNENYARELLQLFSIGLWQLNQDGTAVLDAAGQPLPSYTQTDIKEIRQCRAQPRRTAIRNTSSASCCRVSRPTTPGPRRCSMAWCCLPANRPQPTWKR